VKQRLKKFFPHLNINSSTLFYPLFVAVLTCGAYVSAFSFELNEKYNGIISWNSMQNFDTNARIRLYFNCLVIGILVFLGITFLINLVRKHFPMIQPQLKLLNFTGLFGGLSGIYFLFSPDVVYVSNFLFGFSSLNIVSIVLQILLRRRTSLKIDFSELLIWSTICGFLIFVILNYQQLYYNNYPLKPFPELIFYFALFIYFCAILLENFLKTSQKQLIKYSSILPWMALYTIILNEMIFFGNQRGYMIEPKIVFLFGLIFMLVLAVFLWRRKSNTFVFLSRMSSVFYPVTLVIVVLYGYYNAFLPLPTELFETANPANAVMRTFVFHEVPFVDYMNSHMLSETFFGFMYTLINGYSGTYDFASYDYFVMIIYILCCYYWVKELFGDSVFAFAFSLFFPFLMVAVSGLSCIVLVSVFFIRKVYLNPGVKNWLINFFWMTFLILWRLDGGVANFMAQGILLIFILIFIDKKRRSFLISFAVFAGIAGLLLLSGYLYQPHLFENMRQAWHYIGANQAHGAISIGNVADTLFVIQYMVFPAVIALMMLWLIFNFKKQFRNHIFLFSSFVFLGLFYFFNYQRGLVRHGFNENNDGFLTSFSFLLLSLFTVVLLIRKRSVLKMSVFTITLFVLILAFKFPDNKGLSSEATVFFKNYKEFKPYKNSRDKIQRALRDNGFEEKNRTELKSFFDKNFSPNATFIDFSNTPALYYFLKKPVPSYFNQYMQNTVDGYLQKVNIRNLKEFEIPIVVFSNQPKTWFDKTDGVENTYRYYLMAEYVYQNYHPFRIMSNHSLWIKNDITLSDTSGIRDTVSVLPCTIPLEYLPYLEGIRADKKEAQVIQVWNKTDMSVSAESCIIPLKNPIDKSNGNIVEIVFQNTGANDIRASLDLIKDSTVAGTFDFAVKKTDNAVPYRIRVSTLYQWYASTIREFRLHYPVGGFLEIKEVKLLKGVDE
jgi:hypothetical protein